ncbi:hypothetical protein [Sphingobacterium siyangense]
MEVTTDYDLQEKVLDIRYKVLTASYSKQIEKKEADSLISTLALNDSK